ncbi:hypothetical protein JZU46_02400 [bacterium]|jgi:hypothetical protein|nr:hypothetical protein [bacterium]
MGKLISTVCPKVVSGSSQNQVGQTAKQVSDELESLGGSDKASLLLAQLKVEVENLTRRENASKKLLIDAQVAAEKVQLKMDVALIQARGLAERESNCLDYIQKLELSQSNGRIESYRHHVQLHDMKQELTKVRGELAAALSCKQKTSSAL